MDKRANSVTPIAVTLRKHRQKLGLTQQDLQQKTEDIGKKVSLSAIQRAERGCPTYLSTLSRIADALAAPVDTFLARDCLESTPKESVLTAVGRSEDIHGDFSPPGALKTDPDVGLFPRRSRLEMIDAILDKWKHQEGEEKEIERDLAGVLEDRTGVEFWWALGVWSLSVEKFEEARAAFREAVSISDRFTKGWYRLGQVSDRLGDSPTALHAYTKTLELEPDLAEAWCDKAILLAKAGQYKEAESAFYHATILKNNDAYTWLNYGILKREMGQWPEAIEAFEHACQSDPSDAKAFDAKGSALRHVSRLEEAVLSAETAVKLDPKYAGAWFNLGGTLHELGRISEAWKALDKSLKLGHPREEVLKIKYTGLWIDGRFEESLRMCEEAIMSSDDALAVQTKMMILAKLKRFDECLRFIDEHMQRTQVSTSLLVHKAGILAETGRAQEGLLAVRKALAMAPKDCEARVAEAYCLAKLGKTVLALRRIDKVLEMDVSNANIWIIKADIAGIGGMASIALKCVRRACKLDPSCKERARDDNDLICLRGTKKFEDVVG